MNDRATRIVVLLLALAFALSPLLSNGFGGFYPESFPVQVDRWPAQPAGWAFSICGLIYLGLILAAIWALWQPASMPGWPRAAGPLGISLFIGIFVEHYNHIRYHESIDNLTPADVYFDRAEPILAERRRFKLATIANRRLQHRLQAP